VAGVGNKAIALKNCRNVTLRDFAILEGGHFGVLATGVDNFTVDNLLIDTNRDGINLDCCRNVRVSNVSANSPRDDAICLKSSYALGEARATEMVTISNCMVSGGWAIGSLLDGSFKSIPVEQRRTRSGRIKFGTESYGAFQRITISNCVFDGCGGLALECVNGGVLEDVTVTNLTMREIGNSPIFLRLGRRGAQDAPVGALRRVIISNISCSNSVSRYGSIVSGIPGHQIEHVKIRDVYIQHQGGGTREMAALEPAENETGYPDPPMFGDLPSHGFFLRHAKDVEISNVEIEPMKPDLRPAFWANDVEDVALYRVKAPRERGAPAFALKNVRNFSVSASAPLLKDTLVDRSEPIEL
jgi:polygalacturonase